MIEVVSVARVATVQDAGRPGRMHQGVPPGGALVPELLARANAWAKNRAGDAAIEAFGAITLAAHGGPAVVGCDSGESFTLADGEARTFTAPDGRVHYVAVRGGVDVPLVLGGRGTLAVAGFGGHQGRPLRRGDALSIGTAPPRDPDGPPPAAPDRSAAVRVILGPDLDRFEPGAAEALLGSTFVVDSRSSRVGTRLAGPRLTAGKDADGPSAPMVRGAIQVPPSGEPIVLGPDHPTTGGYPVIATVVHEHLGSLTARAIGARVCFVT